MVLPILELSPYHRSLTDFAIKNLREKAKEPFELVIVETGEKSRLEKEADVYVHVSERTCIAHDMNLGLEAASSKIVGHTANDLVFEDDWDQALLEPWIVFESDCGATTLLANTHKPPSFLKIEEGFYGPVMTYKNTYRFDAERFPNIFGDTDLVMRIYRDGWRCYRNHSGKVRHLGGGEQTWRDVAGANRAQLFHEARDRFREVHQHSGIMMFRALWEGWAV